MDQATALTTTVSPSRAMDVLLACEGNLDMACELLGTPAKPAPKSAVVKALADSPQGELGKALRVFSMLEAHDLRRKVKLIAEATLNELEGSEAFKAYVDISDQVQELTKPQQAQATGGNTFQFIFDNLPREAGNVVKGLAKLDPSAREELRRIAEARTVHALTSGPDEASAELVPARASAGLDEERGVTGARQGHAALGPGLDASSAIIEGTAS